MRGQGQSIFPQTHNVGPAFHPEIGVVSPDFPIDFTLFASSGSGSAISPYSGWDTALTPLADFSYFFRPGKHYNVSVPTDWGKRGLRILGNGAFLHCVGGYVSIESGSFIPNVHLENLIISGENGTPTVLKLRHAILSSLNNIFVGDATGVAVLLESCVNNNFNNLYPSVNAGYFTVKTGVTGLQTDLGCNANKFNGGEIAGCSGDALIIGGTLNRYAFNAIEGNSGRGIVVPLSVYTRNNRIVDTFMEVNALGDIYETSAMQTYENIRSSGIVKCGDGGNFAQGTRFVGGAYDGPSFTIDGPDNSLENVRIANLVDNGVNTRLLGYVGP